jgi:hypothetical protein
MNIRKEIDVLIELYCQQEYETERPYGRVTRNIVTPQFVDNLESLMEKERQKVHDLYRDGVEYFSKTAVQQQVLRGKIEQMHIEAEAYRKTLDLFRINNPNAKLPRGLPLGFQKRINELEAELSKLGGS